jgi:hypothetical protein
MVRNQTISERILLAEKWEVQSLKAKPYYQGFQKEPIRTKPLC